MSETRYDAIVIGAGVGGLAAAALLAKAGRHTLLVERQPALFGTLAPATLSALDPRLAKMLKLAKHGFGYAARDLPLAAPNLLLSRDRHATARSLASLMPTDAAAYTVWRREMLSLAKALRPAWWDGKAVAEVSLKPAQRVLLDRLTVSSAIAHLCARFESDALRAALAFAAAECGAVPSEPGSALALLWSAAQEANGAQGAVSLPKGGVLALLRALSDAAQAAGAEVRTATPVARLLTSGGAVTGVELAAGESIETPLVFCALGRRHTLATLLPPAELGLGTARTLARPVEEIGNAVLVFALSAAPNLPAPPDARFLIAERPEIYESAFAEARAGRNAREPVLELVREEPTRLVVRVWPVAPSYARSDLVRTVTLMIERHASGFANLVVSADLLEPETTAPVPLERLLASAQSRIETPLRGLYMVGADAEPANALSGRAARLAVALSQKARPR
ncbi:MAG TPA: FAD-dependent oxidoreductase [Rhizomicrobium sp.]|jgi:phytoene dehydrogenase-like protein|nr:FAD-dependent oxidoreductase [Rhizomicrobium sp.]